MWLWTSPANKSAEDCWFDFLSHKKDKFAIFVTISLLKFLLVKISPNRTNFWSSPAMLNSVNLYARAFSALLKQIYFRFLLNQLIHMCNFFSWCKCSYIPYDAKKRKFVAAKRINFWSFCAVTLLWYFFTFLLICELVIEKKCIFQYIVFSITVSITIYGGVVGASSILDSKVLTLFLNWIIPISDSMDRSMYIN